MDKDTARAYLTAPQGKKFSEIGEAVDVLRPDYRSYKAMAHEFPEVSEKTLGTRRRIFQLPKGIRWKIDEGQISLGKGDQIGRLKNEDDQWLLAFAIVEEQLDEDVCSNVVNRVLNYNDSIRDALRAAASVQCDKIVPLMLPLDFDTRLAIAQKAWNLDVDWDEYCYDHMSRDVVAVPRELAKECRALLSQLQDAMSQLLDT